ncbi:MAG: patatin-like phospholipase family protein [Candidatus Obscuribacterales bacterium]|nr:patatin-like phospholipase family protein [Candidatus Obscuribacterales bacterium]
MTAFLLTVSLQQPALAANADSCGADTNDRLAGRRVLGATPENASAGTVSAAAEPQGRDGASSTRQTGAVQGSPALSIRRPRIGLALGGGGTRGTAHIGVLRVLEAEGIPIDCIAGTSMGAIVGGLYCAGVPLKQIEAMIYNRKLMHSYLTVPIPLRVAVVPVFFLPHMVGYHPYDGLYRGRRFAKFLRNAVPTDCRLIENMQKPFCAVAANLLDGKGYGITKGDFGTAVQASSALPFLRRPVDFEDKLLVDGGLVENLPCERVRKMGADVVIAVDVDDDLTNLTRKDFRKIGASIARALNMHLSAIDAPQKALADVVIHPDVTGIRLLSLDMKDVHRAIQSGTETTLKAIPLIKRIIKEKSIAAEGAADAS